MEINNKRNRYRHLPDEIIQEILSNLPIQSLFQTRYVCKSWRALINNTRLFKMHYTQQSCRKIHNTHTTSLILHHSSQLYYIPNFNEKNMIELKNLPFKSWLPKFSLIGSCNGFICVADMNCRYRSIFVCNPVIGDWFLVPNDDKSLCKVSEQVILGFGYEPKRNEYKVVRMIRGEVKLHTVGSDCWRKVGNVKGILYDWTGTSGVLVNGNLHWLGNLDDFTRVCIIVVCLADEKVQDLLTVPVEGIVGKINQGYYLGELGGCLTIVDDSFDGHVNVWVMKEYGNSESLRKQYVIARPLPILALYENRLRPLVLQNDGEILLQGNAGEFFSYNPRTNSLPNRLLQIEGTPSPLKSIRAVTHVGTLLPMKEAIQTEWM